MSDEDRIDFGALDPQRDARRWEAMVQHTLSRSALPSAWSELLAALPRARLTLAALAAVAVLTWLPALMSPGATTTTQAGTPPALALVQFHESSDVTALLESADGY